MRLHLHGFDVHPEALSRHTRRFPPPSPRCTSIPFTWETAMPQTRSSNEPSTEAAPKRRRRGRRRSPELQITIVASEERLDLDGLARLLARRILERPRPGESAAPRDEPPPVPNRGPGPHPH